MTAGGSEFTPTEVERARRIRRETGILFAGFLVVVAIVWTAVITWLTTWQQTHAASVPWWQLLLLDAVIVLGAIETIRVGWPVLQVSVVGRRQLGQRFGSTMARALLVSSLLRLVATILAVVPVWWLARTSEWAWLAVGPIVLALNVILSVGFLRQLRWMYELRPLDDPRCRSILRELTGGRDLDASAWVLPASEIGPQINAAVGPSGFRGQALVVFDTALALPDDQLRALLAHELGHIELEHVRRRWVALAVLSALAAVAALALAPRVGLVGAQRAAWNEGEYVGAPPGTPTPPGTTFVPVEDIPGFGPQGWLIDVPVRGLPFLVVDFVWLWLFGTALASLFVLLPRSRRQEQEADWFALDRTQDPAAFQALIHTIAATAGQEPTKGSIARVGCTHAPPAERIRAAEDWARGSPSARS